MPFPAMCKKYRTKEQNYQFTREITSRKSQKKGKALRAFPFFTRATLEVKSSAERKSLKLQVAAVSTEIVYCTIHYRLVKRNNPILTEPLIELIRRIKSKMCSLFTKVAVPAEASQHLEIAYYVSLAMVQVQHINCKLKHKIV